MMIIQAVNEYFMCWLLGFIHTDTHTYILLYNINNCGIKGHTQNNLGINELINKNLKLVYRYTFLIIMFEKIRKSLYNIEFPFCCVFLLYHTVIRENVNRNCLCSNGGWIGIMNEWRVLALHKG